MGSFLNCVKDASVNRERKDRWSESNGQIETYGKEVDLMNI